MNTKSLDVAVAAFFLAFGVYVLIAAFSYGVTSPTGPGAGTFPLIAGALITVFAACTLVRSLRNLGSEGEVIGLGEIGRVAGILAVLGLYVLAFHPLGAFLPLPFLIIGISLVIQFRTDPAWLVKLATLALAFTLSAYFIFAVFLRVLLPTGPFGF